MSIARFTLVSLSLSLSAVAFGFDCSSGLARSAYNAAYQSYKSSLDDDWNRLGYDCDTIDSFDSALQEFDIPRNGTARQVCRTLGWNAAIADFMEEKYRGCQQVCQEIGGEAGETEARRFCRMSLTQEQRAASTCTLFERQACRKSFTATVIELCPERLGSQEFKRRINTFCSSL